MTLGPVRLGLIGAGRWGRNYIRSLEAIDGAALVCVASGNSQTKDLISPQCRIVRDWRDLLLVSELDGVIIATPPSTHAEILIASLEAGKSVLVEKPLVTSRHDLAAIEFATNGTNLTVMVQHTHLFHPAFRAMKQKITQFGKPIAIRSSAGNRGPYRQDVSVLWDWAPHDVAMALALVPGHADVAAARLLERRTIDGVSAERIQLSLSLAHEIPCSITISTLDPKHRWFAVDFENDTLIYMDDGTQLLRHFAHTGAQVVDEGASMPVTNELPLAVALREFVNAVGQKRPKRNSLLLGCQVVAVLSQCEEVMTYSDPQIE